MWREVLLPGNFTVPPRAFHSAVWSAHLRSVVLFGGEVHDTPVPAIWALRVEDDSWRRIERARAQIRTSFLMARESTSSRAEDAAQQMLVYGIPRSVGDLIGQIDAVDAAALRQEAELILSTPVTLAAVGPLDDPAALHQLGERLRPAA